MSCACQDAITGLWHAVLDDPTSHFEASASAVPFAYGILKSLRMRLIPKEDIGGQQSHPGNR
jgi:unsaturated rhamnogalacturonyl hydrolase